MRPLSRAPGEPFVACADCTVCRDCGPRQGAATSYQLRPDECNECGDVACPNSPRSKQRAEATS